MDSCPICGKSAAREWRHCPKMDNQLICGSEHCIECEHWRKPEDKGTFWCTYRHGRTEKQNIDVKATKKLIIEKKREAKVLYKKAKWKEADRLIREAEKLEDRVKEAKK